MKSASRNIKSLTNRYLMPLLTIAVIISLTLVGFSNWNIAQISRTFQQEVLTKFQLQSLTEKIIYLDEVLTMSARMAAATGDLKWQQRYLKYEPELDTAIKTVIKLVPEAYTDHAVQTDEANIKLVEMETKSFKLIAEKKLDQSLAILFSSSYDTQKKIYADGMNKTISYIRDNIQENLDSYSQKLSRSNLFSVISFPVLVGAWLTILGLVNLYIRQRDQAEVKIKLAKQELEMTNESLAISEEELRQKAEYLENTLKELQKTQTRLIQSEKMSSLGQLVAGVAHEINNPVNFIHGNLPHIQTYVEDMIHLVELYQEYYPDPDPEIQDEIEAIELDFLEEDLRKILNSMRVGTNRIRQIVLSLRNFSRMDEADFKDVDIHEGIDSTLMILQHRLKATSERPEIEIIKNYDDLPLIDCYAGQMNQVFMNILSNAIDALEEGNSQRNFQEITEHHNQIKITTSRLNNDRIKIIIADNGIGISEEVKKRIFDPFFTTKPIGKGTGMGMSISYQIITEKHKGKLKCISTPNQGTEFIIEIPIKQTN